MSGRLNFRRKVRKKVIESGPTLPLSGVEPALVNRSDLLNILCPFWNEWCSFVSICPFLFVVKMSSQKVGRRCCALPFEVE